MTSRSIDIEPIHIYLWMLRETPPQHLVINSWRQREKVLAEAELNFIDFRDSLACVEGSKILLQGFIRKRVYVPTITIERQFFLSLFVAFRCLLSLCFHASTLFTSSVLQYSFKREDFYLC